MKSKKEELVQNILLILKMDAKNLYDRIKNRKKEYLLEFSLKRKRDHFKEIFFHIFRTITVEDLKYCGQDVLIALDQFYTTADELSWYLNHTQDMINMAEDKVEIYLKQLKKRIEVLTLYVDAELGFSGGHDESHESASPDNIPVEEPIFERLPEMEDHSGFTEQEGPADLPPENILGEGENT